MYWSGGELLLIQMADFQTDIVGQQRYNRFISANYKSLGVMLLGDCFLFLADSLKFDLRKNFL